MSIIRLSVGSLLIGAVLLGGCCGLVKTPGSSCGGDGAKCESSK